MVNDLGEKIFLQYFTVDISRQLVQYIDDRQNISSANNIHIENMQAMKPEL